MKPLSNKIYAVPIPEQQKTESGLSASSNLKKGKVVAVSPLVRNEGGISEGDTILYEKGTEIPFSHNGQDGFFIPLQNIFTVL